jgi:(2Fe-2S) ferredoxin
MSLHPDKISCHILCCFGSSCRKHGAEDVYHALKHELKEEHLQKDVHITKTHCNHLCKHGPVVMVYPDGTWHEKMTPKGAGKLVRKQIKKGKVLKKRVLTTLTP